MRKSAWGVGLVACAIGCALTGCATITGSATQSVSIVTVDRQGRAVLGAECRVNNDKGIWSAKSPSHVTVGRSGEDLSVHCTADGHEPGLVKVISRANGGMVGNVVFGGAVGALIDNSGAGYDYPNQVKVVMGASLVTDKRDEMDGGASSETHAIVPASSPEPTTAAASASPARATTLDDLKDLLPEKR